MDGKLTLSIEPEVIGKAKIWARRKKKSLSALVEEFLKRHIDRDADSNEDPLTIIKSFAAKQTSITDAEVKQRIHDHRMKKYGGT